MHEIKIRNRERGGKGFFSAGKARGISGKNGFTILLGRGGESFFPFWQLDQARHTVVQNRQNFENFTNPDAAKLINVNS